MTRAVVFCLAAGMASAQTISLTVNTDTVLHAIDEKIYGQSLEHIYHSASGGPGNPGGAAEERNLFLRTGGFRPDLTQAVAALHPPIIRWTGGPPAGEYKWKDDIGPQSKRAGHRRGDEVDPPSFGIDEFLAFTQKVGAEPVVVIRVGPGSKTERATLLRDAADLLDYCNGPRESVWGKIRTRNGHPEPYRVKYWEIDTETGKLPPAESVEALGQFVTAMKQVDPTIRTIGPGGLADYFSVHLDERSKNPKAKLFVSGWKTQNADWLGGLQAGAILNAMERDAAVAMAAASPDNALIGFDRGSWFPSPNYVVMKLYREHFAPEVLEIAGNLGDLSATATRTADREKIYLKLVNAREQDVSVAVVLRGDFPLLGASMRMVAPDRLTARNTLEQPAAVQAVPAKVERIGMTARLRLPRWSVAVVTLSR